MKKFAIATLVVFSAFASAADALPSLADAITKVNTTAKDYMLKAVAGAPLYVEKDVKVTVSPNVAVIYKENNTAFVVGTGSAKGTGAVFGVGTNGGSTSKCTEASLKAAPKDANEIISAVSKIDIDTDGSVKGCNS